MKKILYTLLTIICLAACSKEQDITTDTIKFRLGFGGTKATATSFEQGDAVSIYAVEYADDTQMPLQIGGNFINNEKLVFDGTDWKTTGRSLYWSDKACDFYGVYPYQSSINSIEAYPFTISTDQNGDEYEKSDLLYAYTEHVSRADGAVDFQFKHIMSKLIVKVEKGPKFEGEIPDDIEALIYNTNIECNVNFARGSVEKNIFGAKKNITMKKVNNQLFEAVVVPQNIERVTPLIELNMGGIAYLLEYSISFRAGYAHTVTVTLNTSPDQEHIDISIDPGINPWN